MLNQIKLIPSAIYIIAFWVFVLAGSFQVSAHQQKLALTKILFNERTQKLEIMHRFELHDAEHAVKEILGGSADIIASQETQTEFADYVFKRFGLYSKDDEALPLTQVGYEVEGKHFWVYQETELPQKLDGIQVVHNALRDIWFTQSNTVNIEMNDQTSTLTFNERTEVLTISFAK